MQRLRLVFLCPPISGHLHPTLALAREMKDRGHSVFLAGFLDAEDKARAAGVPFVPVGAKLAPRGWVRERVRQQGVLQGAAALRFIVKVILEENAAYMDDLPAVLDELRPDGLALDQLAYGALSVAQHRRMPYVTLCNALPIHPDLGAPPCNTVWKPGRSLLRRMRNGLVYHTVQLASRSALAPINRRRREWNLPPLSANRGGESPLLQLAQEPECFEFPSRRFPPAFRFTGPWRRSDSRQSVPFPYEKLDGRPLIYASMGTLQNRLFHVFHAIAEACLGLPARLVISLGSELNEAMPPFPGDPIVVPFAPQLELLEKAKLVVTHAGLNTALETLSAGVPMVAIPVANDQPGIARRIQFHGAGEFVTLKKLTPARLRQAITKVLDDPRYRASAEALRRKIEQAEGLAAAARLMEEAFTRSRCPHADTAARSSTESAMALGR